MITPWPWLISRPQGRHLRGPSWRHSFRIRRKPASLLGHECVILQKGGVEWPLMIHYWPPWVLIHLWLDLYSFEKWFQFWTDEGVTSMGLNCIVVCENPYAHLKPRKCTWKPKQTQQTRLQAPPRARGTGICQRSQWLRLVHQERTLRKTPGGSARA